MCGDGGSVGDDEGRLLTRVDQMIQPGKDELTLRRLPSETNLWGTTGPLLKETRHEIELQEGRVRSKEEKKVLTVWISIELPRGVNKDDEERN